MAPQDSSLSILDRDGPAHAPHHLIVAGHAYWIDAGELTTHPADDLRWADGIGVEAEPNMPGFDELIAALEATEPAEPLRITTQHLGGIDKADPGADVFYAISVHPDQGRITAARVHAAFLPLVYREGRGPGAVFCHHADVVPRWPDDDCHSWIGIAMVRRDV